MAMAKTKYLEDKILDHVLRNVIFTPPTAVYLALFTADPGEIGSLENEISDPVYERQLITFGAPMDDTDSGKIIKSINDIEFPQASVDWGIITHVMVMDSKTEGNGLYYGPVSNPKTIAADDYVKVPASELVIKED